MKRNAFVTILMLAMLIVSLVFSVQAEQETDLNQIDNSSLSAKFSEGTTEAVCPKCGGEPVVWTAINDITASGSNLDAGHYYLTGEYNNYLSISGNKEVCIHLNGNNWVNKVKSRALYMSGSSACTVNIMGEGTVSGNDGYTGRTTRGATIELNGTGATLNLLGGTYTKGVKNSANQAISGPTVALYTSGGNINMYAGATITGGTDTKGMNVRVPYGTFHMYGGTITGGRGSQGGNVYVGYVEDTEKTGTFIMDGGFITNGTASGYGGNIRVEGGGTHSDTAPKAVFTMNGGTISGGSAANNGGNVYITTNGIATICGTLKDNVSANFGGNLAFANSTQVTLDGALISGGVAEKGANIYQQGSADIVLRGNTRIVDGQWCNQQNACAVDVAADYCGTAAIYFEEGHLQGDVYGTALKNATCQGIFTGELYLDGDYDMPEIYSKGDGKLYVSGAQIVGETAKWVADNAQAVAEVADDEYIKIYAPSVLELTEEKDYNVDLNGQSITLKGIGTLNVAMGDGTFQPVDLGITGVSIRPSRAGIYYSAKWNCGDALAQNVSTFGVAVSLADMPNYAFDEDTLWTEFAGAAYVGEDKVNTFDDQEKTSVIIANILSSDQTVAQNDLSAKTDVYAAAYITLADGSTVVSGEEVAWSLYDIMKTLDTEVGYAIHGKKLDAFYEEWESVMSFWKRDYIGQNAEETLNILFIGNSYTYYNDMPTAYFAPMAESSGYNVNVTSITKGSYTLEKYADPADDYGALVANALSGENKYDYVILQEQSHRPATNAPLFYSSVRSLVEDIRAIGAQPVLYATWGRKDGSETLETYGFTSEEMTWKLAAAYDAIGRELDIPVVQVGAVFRDVYTGSTIELYNSDKSHPSAAGSYLAAMTLCCKIFDVDPDQISITGPVSEEEDAIIKNAVRNPSQIPESYITDSNGVTVAGETA